MYPHSFLWHYLWIAPHALQIIIAIVMLRRGLFREFPVFFTYTVFQIRWRRERFSSWITVQRSPVISTGVPTR